jgi:hypothetical protein
MRIVVSGMIAADPFQGGATWAVLQYVLGLRALGHEVVFIEPIDGKQIQPAGISLDDSTSARYLRRVVAEFGLQPVAALLERGTRRTVGLSYESLLQATWRADLLLNISGLLDDRELTGHIPIRAYLDLDPAFNQVWAHQGIDMRFEGHTHFVTIGLAIGESGCPVPTCGRSWIKTLQPIVLEHWPVAQQIEYDGLTTVGNWRGYGSVEHDGVHYGQKAHSLRKFVELPARTSERFMPALAIHPGETKDLAALAANRWQLLDPAEVASTPSKYQQFIQGSKAELGIAKSGYVVSRCGWFSDRSVCYLASGRPVIAQETGFSDYLPTGNGLLPFTSSDDALAAIESLHANYPAHRRAARALAEEFFDSRRVLSRLLDQLGAAP